MLLRHQSAQRHWKKRNCLTRDMCGKRFKFWEQKFYQSGGKSCRFMAEAFLTLHGFKQAEHITSLEDPK